ncbi:MAG: hypothetical protein ABI882_16710 [Acidobacteriota bacterium]
MYDWRKMLPEEKTRAIALRKSRDLPWHSPPHLDLEGERQYLISASCHEHREIIGRNPERMSDCEKEVLSVCVKLSSKIFAWFVLPNHSTCCFARKKSARSVGSWASSMGARCLRGMERMTIEGERCGTTVFERPMKSQRQFWATMNYVHHNPVHHGYVEQWQEWLLSMQKFPNQ